MKTPIEVRLIELSEDAESGCREWLAFRDKDGYGKVKFQGRQLHAHRVSHMVFVGPIPNGYQIDHLCRNPACILPAHLEAVTGSENLRRQREALKQGEYATHCKNGHTLDESNLFVPPSGGNQCRTCNREKQRRYYHQRKVSA